MYIQSTIIVTVFMFVLWSSEVIQILHLFSVTLSSGNKGCSCYCLYAWRSVAMVTLTCPFQDEQSHRFYF